MGSEGKLFVIKWCRGEEDDGGKKTKIITRLNRRQPSCSFISAHPSKPAVHLLGNYQPRRQMTRNKSGKSGPNHKKEQDFLFDCSTQAHRVNRTGASDIHTTQKRREGLGETRSMDLSLALGTEAAT